MQVSASAGYKWRGCQGSLLGELKTFASKTFPAPRFFIPILFRTWPLFFELAVVQLRIRAVLRKQFFVRALFDDVAFVEHEDRIRILDG